MTSFASFSILCRRRTRSLRAVQVLVARAGEMKCAMPSLQEARARSSGQLDKIHESSTIMTIFPSLSASCLKKTNKQHRRRSMTDCLKPSSSKKKKKKRLVCLSRPPEVFFLASRDEAGQVFLFFSFFHLMCSKLRDPFGAFDPRSPALGELVRKTRRRCLLLLRPQAMVA